MDEKELLESLAQEIKDIELPDTLFASIRDAKVEKMTEHDDITRQDQVLHVIPSECNVTTNVVTNRKKKRNRVVSSLLLFAVMLLLIVGGYNYYMNQITNWFYLDVNTSIQLQTARNGKVKCVIAANKDGEIIVQNLEFTGQTIEQAVASILDEMILAGIITQDETVLISDFYQEKKDSQLANLGQNAYEHLKNREIVPIVVTFEGQQGDELTSFAKANDLSEGKAQLIREIAIMSKEYEVNSLRNLTLDELMVIVAKEGIKLADNYKIYGELEDRMPEPESVSSSSNSSESNVSSSQEPKATVEPVVPTPEPKSAPIPQPVPQPVPTPVPVPQPDDDDVDNDDYEVDDEHDN